MAPYVYDVQIIETTDLFTVGTRAIGFDDNVDVVFDALAHSQPTAASPQSFAESMLASTLL